MPDSEYEPGLPEPKAQEEAPRPLHRAIASAEEYPVSALGPLIGPAVNAIQQKVRCPLPIAAQSALAAACLSVQAHANVKLPTGACRPTSLFLVTIADSGERKTAADECALAGVVAREHELKADYDLELFQFENDLAAHKSQREQILRNSKLFTTREMKRAALDELGPRPVGPLTPLLTCPEPTFEGLTRLLREGLPSIGLYSDEGGQFIGGHAMNEDNRLKTASGLSTLWDGGTLKRVRSGEGAIVLPNRRVCLHLQVQPLVATRMFDDPLLADQGLLSRVLAAQPENAAGTRFWQEPTTEAQAQLIIFTQQILSNLKVRLPLASSTRNELNPRTLPLSDAARELWIGFADHVEKLIGPDKQLEPIKGLANKAPEHAARIAAVRELTTDMRVDAISEEAMADGIKLVQFYLGEALRIRLIARVNADLVLAEKLLVWLQKSWTDSLVSLPDVYQYGPRPIDDRSTAERIVTVLEEHGWLKNVLGPVQVKGVTRQRAWKVIRTEL